MKITKKILQDIIKEEVSKIINEEGIKGLPSNREFTTEEAIPLIINEIERLMRRVGDLETAQQ